jgi:hypothetical protein
MESELKKPALGFLIPDFKEQSERVSFTYGRPDMRVQFLRGTVWGLSKEQIRKRIIENTNAITGQPMMRETIEKLTAPLTAAELDMSEKKMDVGPATYTDTEENLHKLFLDKRYTDFLQITLPTEERVNAMLAQTSHDPDKHLATMNPGSVAGENWTYTVRHAAIAAVMAGAKPEYFPIILAIGSTGHTALNVTDNGIMYGVVINGRIRDEIGLNYDVGAVGPFAHANTTIGRAWSLLSINGGNCGKAGTTYMGTVGNTSNLVNVVIAENEENSPWEPFSVRRGYRKGDNIVTLFRGWGILSAKNWAVSERIPATEYARTIQGIHREQSSGQGTIAVLSPPVANLIYDSGYDTVEKLTEYVTAPDPNAPKPKGGGAKPKAAAAKPDPEAAPIDPATGILRASGAGGAFTVIVTGSSNNNYWMMGGMAPTQSVQIDAWR